MFLTWYRYQKRATDTNTRSARKWNPNLRGVLKAFKKSVWKSSAVADGSIVKSGPFSKSPRVAKERAKNLLQVLPESVRRFPDAEPLLTALVQLVKALPEHLYFLHVGSSTSDVKNFLRLGELPLGEEGLAQRTKRLARLQGILDAVAQDMLQEDETCRKAHVQTQNLLSEEIRHNRLSQQASILLRSSHFKLGCLSSRTNVIRRVLSDMPDFLLVHWSALLNLDRLPEPSNVDYVVDARVAFEQHGSNAIVVCVARVTFGEPDPVQQQMLARQMLSFANWYQSRWGSEVEPYFWIDCCCLPTLGTHPEAAQSACRNTQVCDTLESLSTIKKTQTSLEPFTMGTTLLQLADDPSLTFGTSLNSKPYTKIFDIPDNQKQKMQTLLGITSHAWTEASVDALIPLAFAASDAVLFCEDSGDDSDSWARMGLALAHAFSPAGSLVYFVDRKMSRVKQKKFEQVLDAC